MIIGKQVANLLGLTDNFANWHVLVFAVLNFHVLLDVFISLMSFLFGDAVSS